MLSALYAITRPSVYLSVCLSVTRVDQSKMAEVRVTHFLAYYPSSFCLVSFYPEILTGSHDLVVKQGRGAENKPSEIGF